jgi:hypothetical protein
MQAYLKKHGPNVAAHTIKVDWSVSAKEAVIEFVVNKRSSRPWLSDPAFSQDWSKNWGLWNTDVIEAFIQLRSTPSDLKAPYLEIQVSPANHPFALIIEEPRQIFYAPKILDFSHEVLLEGRSWKTSVKVVLPSDLRGTLPYGGFYACLDKDPREYFALEPNPENDPDFHRPEFFVPLNHE